MCDADLTQEFKEFYDAASALPDALPDGIAESYDVVGCSGSEDSLLFTLARKSDGLRFALRRSPLESGRAAREYEILSCLNVDGVPRAVSYCEQHGFGWLLREYAEGEDLGSAISCRGPFDADETRSVLCRLCDILAELHRQSPPVVHRDVKPQNVILAPDGGITLIDFDAARRFDSSARADTEYLGTRDFAPPEQFGYAQTDPRSDVYSLGVLLLYLFTGSCELARAKELPEPLRRIFERCTAFSPKDRFFDASEVKAALTGKAQRKKRTIYAALGAVLALAAGVFLLMRGAPPLSANDAALKEALAVSQSDGVYMIGSESFAAREEYYEARSHDPSSYSRGEISDLTYLVSVAPKTRELMLVNQPLSSLGTLEGLDFLENLSVDYCGITALDGIEKLPRLSALSLTDTAVADISALLSCESINNLCVRGIPCFDFSPLAKFKRFNFLDIAGIPRSLTLPHLEDCSVGILKADYTGLASFDELGGITDLETLEVNNNSLSSLDGIERYTSLRYLDISGNPITDYSPLAELPQLSEVVCDASQLPALEALGCNFELLCR